MNVVIRLGFLLGNPFLLDREKQETIQAKNSIRVCELWTVSILQITQKSCLEGFEPKWQTDLDL